MSNEFKNSLAGSQIHQGHTFIFTVEKKAVSEHISRHVDKHFTVVTSGTQQQAD